MRFKKKTHTQLASEHQPHTTVFTKTSCQATIWLLISICAETNSKKSQCPPFMPLQLCLFRRLWRHGQKVKDTVERSMLAVEGKIFTRGSEIRDEIQHPFVAPIALCCRWLAHSRSISVAHSDLDYPEPLASGRDYNHFHVENIKNFFFVFCLFLGISRIQRQKYGGKAQPFENMTLSLHLKVFFSWQRNKSI